MKYIAAFLITIYQQVVSPWMQPSCRYIPSCSEYAKEALLKHGFFKGSYLAARRLLRCHPFHEGGYDPVP